MPRKKSAKRQKKVLDVSSDVRDLLKRYSCPYPFHQVQAGFIGNIASPNLHVSPLREAERAWNGELPVFASERDIEPFMQTLMMDFYKKLCAHRNRENPFKLVKLKPAQVDLEYIARFGRIRRQELEGFICGFFCIQKESDMPEPVPEAIRNLLEKRESFAAAEKAASHLPEPAEVTDIAQMHENLQEITRAAESGINAVIKSGNAARALAVEMLKNGTDE